MELDPSCKALRGKRCRHVYARETWWSGQRQSEAVSLYLETDDGHWYEFTAGIPGEGWRCRACDHPGLTAAGDDAEVRHPLIAVGAREHLDGQRVVTITTRRMGELAELRVEFQDASVLVAHHRPAPGACSLTHSLHPPGHNPS